MSEGSRVADTVAESVSTITDAVGQGADDLDLDLDHDVGGEEGDGLRESLGRELGTRVGRDLGAVVGRSLGEVVASSAREGNSIRDVLDDVREFLVEVLASLLRDADVQAALSETREFVTSFDASDVTELPSETGEGEPAETGEGEPGGEEPVEEETDQQEADESSVEEGTAESGASEEETGEAGADGTAEATPEESATSPDDLEPEKLRELREETLRDLIGVMSYEDLQSIAKEVDVKANLDRETMTDRIVEAFAEDTEAQATEESAD